MSPSFQNLDSTDTLGYWSYLALCIFQWPAFLVKEKLVCWLLFVKFGITFSLFQFHFMLAPHNFSGSVALNYESYTRNWTVNFTRDKMYFLQQLLYKQQYIPTHVEGVRKSLFSCKIMPSRWTEMLKPHTAPINEMHWVPHDTEQMVPLRLIL